MIKEVFNREDGTEGEVYKLEAGDQFISRYASVGVSKDRAINVKDKKTGKSRAIIVRNKFLGITTLDGEDIVLKITDGQEKSLKKFGDLTGKKIVAYEYKNDYGKQIGCKVVEETTKTTKVVKKKVLKEEIETE